MENIRKIESDGIIRYRNENGQMHRTDGPAYEDSNGTKAWYIDDKLHREDGPASIWRNGDEWYYLNGLGYSKEEWEQEVVKFKLKRILDL